MKSLYSFLIFLIIPSLAISQNREADSLILVDVFQQLNGPNWSNPENWLTAASIEEWKGISVEGGRVTKLEIIQQNAVGLFPDQILGLDQLHTFEIRSADISGSIPEELTQLTKLKRFILSATGIGGEMPNIWTQFPDLNTLSLNQGNLTGSLPDLPDGLSLVNFQGNLLSGPIPQSWEGNELGNLNISFNELTGSFDIFSTWPNLRKIDMDSNNWDAGTLPLWIDDNLELNRFSCNDCNLIGEVPVELDFSQHYSYDGMFLNGNELTGDITLLFPPQDTESLLYLSVSGNQFEGEFPAHAVKGLDRLIVQFNNYESISEFGEIELSVCNVKGNKFTYESLVPVQEFVTNFDVIPLEYKSQQPTLSLDSLEYGVSTEILIQAGDNHPNTIYEWLKNNEIIEGETNADITITIDGSDDKGIYYCKMTNPDFPALELQRNFVYVNWNPSTAVENEQLINVNIYPNPTADFIYVDLTENELGHAYQLIANDGRIVKQAILAEGDKINIENLEDGVYFLKLNIDNKEYIKKIVKGF